MQDHEYSWEKMGPYGYRRAPNSHCSLYTCIRNTGSGIRNTGSGIRNTGSGIRNTGSGIRNTGSGIRNTGSGIRNTGSGIRNTGSGTWLICFIVVHLYLGVFLPGNFGIPGYIYIYIYMFSSFNWNDYFLNGPTSKFQDKWHRRKTLVIVSLMEKICLKMFLIIGFFFLGENESGKTSLNAKLQGTEETKKGSGLEYMYIDVKDDYRDGRPKIKFKINNNKWQASKFMYNLNYCQNSQLCLQLRSINIHLFYLLTYQESTCILYLTSITYHAVYYTFNVLYSVTIWTWWVCICIL